MQKECDHVCAGCQEVYKCDEFLSRADKEYAERKVFNESFPGLSDAICGFRFSDANLLLRKRQRSENLYETLSLILVFVLFFSSSVLRGLDFSVRTFLFCAGTIIFCVVVFHLLKALLPALFDAFFSFSYVSSRVNADSSKDPVLRRFSLWLFFICVVSFILVFFYCSSVSDNKAAAYNEGYELGLQDGNALYISDDPLADYSGDYDAQFLEGYIVGCGEGHNDFYDYLLSEE